jgi:predicted ATPase
MTNLANTIFVLTGGPGSGKTTLLEAAAEAGLHVGHEAARAIIQSQVAIDGPAVEWRDKAMFAELMLDRDIQSFRALATSHAPTLCDRGIPDLIAYGRDNGLGEVGHFHRAAMLYRYNPVVFFAPPWREIYTTDAERTQDWAHAQRVYASLRDAYAELGYRIVELPKTSVAERLAFVMDIIAHA